MCVTVPDGCQSLIDDLGAIIWEADPGTMRVSSVTGKAEELLGYSTSRWLGEPDFRQMFVHPADRESASEVCAAAIRHGRNLTTEYRAVAADGRELWLREVVRLRTADEGRPARLGGVIIDVTNRRRAEETVVRRDTFYRALIEHALDLVTVCDRAGVITFVSPSVQRVLGYAPDEVLGVSMFDLVHGSDLERANAAFARALAVPGCTPVEVRLRHRQGSWRHVESIGHFVADEGDGMVILNSRDVTDRKLLERQFWHAQKMEAIGRLTSTIAHDFNNLLMVILGSTDLLGAREATGPIRAEIDAIRKAAECGESLTRQLLSFSRRRPAACSTIDVNQTIADLSGILRRLLGNRVHLALGGGARPAVITADRGLLEQVLMNLAVNARDAMPDGGHVTINTRNREMPDSRTSQAPDATRPFVVIEVSDTGIGMSAEVQARIFEPFFTTKSDGRGTGLGLATVYGIVDECGGFVEVDSAEGVGTTFRVYLPEAIGPDTDGHASARAVAQ